MPEYAKMKNAELEALLKQRGLPHAGKKADMVERLQKDDEKPAAPAVAKAANAEDEIDWDDDADEASAALPAKGDASAVTKDATPATTADVSVASNPQAASNQAADGEAVTTSEPFKQIPTADAVEGEDNTTAKEKAEPAPDYSIGLAATKLDDEIEKRKKRALKFGIKFEDDDESLKKLERAKKFGEVGPPKGLDEALPERTRKRGRDEGGDSASGHKRRGGGRTGGGRGGRGGQDRRDNNSRDDRDSRRDDRKAGSGSSWMTDKDKAAAEARKAKWANAAA